MKKPEIKIHDLNTGEVVTIKTPTRIRSNSQSTSCVICLDEISTTESIWCCDTCRTDTHLKCIQMWAETKFNEYWEVDWNCPKCRRNYKIYPKSSLCYCKKMENPESTFFGTRFSAHCCYKICDQFCNSTHGDHCKHPCPEKCHPGFCPPCSTLISFKCWCGQSEITIPCSEFRSYNQNKSCQKKCNRLMNCGVHRCDAVCHEGKCQECTEYSLTITCHCKSKSMSFSCGLSIPNIDSFSCDQPCAKDLKCMKHKCYLKCHPGDCPPCENDPEVVTSCACSKTLLSSLGVIRMSCSDPIPTCDKICGKRLVCWDDYFYPWEMHMCEEKCHDSNCPPCKRDSHAPCKCGDACFKTPCADFYYEKINLESCTKKCRKFLSCKKHKCNLVCCDVKIHLCDKICDKIAPCDLHPCAQPCHRRSCPSCAFRFDTIVYCKCKEVFIWPPSKCSDPFPRCGNICRVVCPAGHINEHPCHRADKPCPPCPVLVPIICTDGHVIYPHAKCTVDNMMRRTSCYLNLECGHTCTNYGYFCPENSGEWDLRPCRRPCMYRKFRCKHPCNKACHYPEACPNSECDHEVKIYCPCLRRSHSVKCDYYYWLISAIENNPINFHHDVSNGKNICVPCDEGCKVNSDSTGRETSIPIEVSSKHPKLTTILIKVFDYYNKSQLEEILKTEFLININT